MILNIMNFISVASLLVIRVWLIKGTPESLIAETTVNGSIEQIVKYTDHKFSLVVSAINIHPV